MPKYERRIRADVIHSLGCIFTKYASLQRYVVTSGRVARGAKAESNGDSTNTIADVEKHLEEAIRKAVMVQHFIFCEEPLSEEGCR